MYNNKTRPKLRKKKLEKKKLWKGIAGKPYSQMKSRPQTIEMT